jgi:hypothetical protein
MLFRDTKISFSVNCIKQMNKLFAENLFIYKMAHLMVLHEFFGGYSEPSDIFLIKGIRFFSIS